MADIVKNGRRMVADSAPNSLASTSFETEAGYKRDGGQESLPPAQTSDKMLGTITALAAATTEHGRSEHNTVEFTSEAPEQLLESPREETQRTEPENSQLEELLLSRKACGLRPTEPRIRKSLHLCQHIRRTV